jgi:hypothetical protein
LENGGEFLCQTKFIPNKIVKKEFADIFRNSFDLIPLDTTTFTISKIKEFVKRDFDERLSLLRNHKTGVVVKTFIYSEYYKYFPILINQILDEFNVIFLSRKNTYNGILSGFICEQLGVWHVLEDAPLQATKKQLSTLRFSISENKFIEIVQDTNILSTLQRNIKQIHPLVKTLYFEDFMDSPTNNLNLLLGTNVKSCEVPKLNRFIEDHEAPIINIDKIRNLYKLYTI